MSAPSITGAWLPWNAAASPARFTRGPRAAQGERLLIVSNRLPISLAAVGNEVRIRPSDGGLASALRRVHGAGTGVWIGGMNACDVVSSRGSGLAHELRRGRLAVVGLSELEMRGFYIRYANGILWPRLHGMEPPSAADKCGWGMYRAANARFADAVAARWRPGDLVWVHDYQLLLVPGFVRALRPAARIGFFLHTPMPAPEELDTIEEWPELAGGLLGADVIGFQTTNDMLNFAEWVGAEVDGDSSAVIEVERRRVRLVARPIGVDAEFFDMHSRHPKVLTARAALRRAVDGPVFVGVDRLDYTKGIAERLLAFDRLLDSRPDLHGRAQFVQVAVPSRDGVHGYAALSARIGEIVGRINAKRATPTWKPVEYVHSAIDVDSLVALYQAADVMVVTPKRDGMNLVAKEFVAARSDGGGALVLSRHAGAAAELRAAILVDTSVRSIERGYRRALDLSSHEARARMRTLRAIVASNGVFGWATEFLDVLRRHERVGG